MHVESDELTLLALGEALPDAAAHVATCEECQREVAELRATLEEVRRIGPVEPVALPDGLWERIAAEAFAAPPAAEPGAEADVVDLEAHGARRSARDGGWPRYLIGIAAAAGIVIGGVGASYLNDRESEESLVATATLAPLDDALDTAIARIVQRDGHQVLIVQADGLADARGGFLEVWLLNPDVTGLVTLGPLDADRQEFVLPAALDLSEFPIVDISREPLDGDPTHSGDSLWRGELEDQ